MVIMFRHSLRGVARRAPTFSPGQGKRIFPAMRMHALSLRCQMYSAPAGGNPTQKKIQFDESLRNMDINAAEKGLKDWCGDQATWSYEKLQKLMCIDCLIGQPDLMRFVDYAYSGYRPGGGSPSFPLLTVEELALIDTPYDKWAPAPYNTLTYSCHQRSAPLYMETDDDTALTPPPYAQFQVRLHALKATLWNGMVPMSHDRWLERKMDDSQNYQNLVDLMGDIFTIFAWYNHEECLNRLRCSFNSLVDIYAEFEGAANLRREQNGIQEKLNLAGMWAEYFHATMSDMSNRTHQWLADRVDEVQSRAFTEYTAALQDAKGDQEAIATAGKKYFVCFQSLSSMMAKADYLLSIPMVGFKSYTPSGSALDLPLPVRQDSYNKIAQTKSRKYWEIILQAQNQESENASQKPKGVAGSLLELNNGSKPAEPRFGDHQTLIGHYHESRRNLAEIRRALRGEPQPLSEEYWITILKDRMNFYLKNGCDRETHRWGFVCYRLTYNQTYEEWEDFKNKFEADVFKSGLWIEGYDSIADKAGVVYVDGRDVGIAEGDFEAAKRHFNTTFDMIPTPGRMWTQDFLAIDQQSYASYSTPDPKDIRSPLPFDPCSGNSGGFVRLVDTSEYSQELLDTTSPGYKGELKVLSSIVLEELYPLLTTFAVRPTSLWPLARLHPREVYVGHTGRSQEAWWETDRVQFVSMTKFFFERMREGKKEMLEGK